MRTQYAHIIDMVPTVLDLLDIKPPAQIGGVKQSPMHGVSFAHSLDDPEAASKRHTQYFEMFGHRSIYHDGWLAVCPWPGTSFTESGKPWGQPITSETLSQLDATGWELYRVDENFAETQGVAADNRDRLIAMIGRMQLYVDGSLVGNADADVTTPFVFNPGASLAEPTPAPPSRPTTKAPSPSPERYTASTLTSAASQSTIPKANSAHT
ncbi:MAG: hypothetical protein WBP81_35965 [Solirubrobacteraceae bacterium]